MKLDPLLDAAKRAPIEDALARLDEYKASDMDVAFAKFGVKVRCSRGLFACCAHASDGVTVSPLCPFVPPAVAGD
jgi:hypothetical protein